jgi:hypothetical protein
MFFEAAQLDLVDPDSPIQGDDVIWGKAEDGQLLFSWYSWFGGGFNNDENVANAMGMSFIPIMDQQILVGSIHQDGRGRALMGIGSGAEDPERLIEFFNWMSSPDVFQVVHVGPEGLSWEMVNGEPVVTEFGVEAGMHTQAPTEDFPVPQEWGGGAFDLGSWRNTSMILLHRGLEINPLTGFTYDPRHWPSLAQSGMNPLQMEWTNHFGYVGQPQFLQSHNMMAVEPPHGVIWDWPARSDELNLIHTEVASITWNNAWRMIFAANAAEFDAIWEETVAQAMGLGWQQLEDFERGLAAEYFALVNAYFGR